MKQTTFKISLLFVFAWLLQSCRKEVPKGQIITANGYVIDLMQNKRLPFATVYLFGGHNYRLGEIGVETYYDTIPLDSVLCDANGNFDITYTAEGRSDDYALGITKNLSNPNINIKYLADAY